MMQLVGYDYIPSNDWTRWHMHIQNHNQMHKYIYLNGALPKCDCAWIFMNVPISWEQRLVFNEKPKNDANKPLNERSDKIKKRPQHGNKIRDEKHRSTAQKGLCRQVHRRLPHHSFMLRSEMIISISICFLFLYVCFFFLWSGANRELWPPSTIVIYALGFSDRSRMRDRYRSSSACCVRFNRDTVTEMVAPTSHTLFSLSKKKVNKEIHTIDHPIK